jgi:ABC-type Fe3+/spermidine/putrescine transport system ATPase subunit
MIVETAQTARGAVTLAIRQEDAILTPGWAIPAPGTILVHVKTRVYLGSRYRYIVDLAGQRLSVLAPNNLVLDPGQPADLSIEPARILLLAP